MSVPRTDFFRYVTRFVARVSLLACALLGASHDLFAQPVPGTGQRVMKIGDDFEDPNWSYNFNLPKSSDENDKQQRLPAGASKNGRWYEGVMRGQPDVIQRVATPEDGLPGSVGALLMRSKQTGVPGHFSGQNQQDDLIVDVNSRLGGPICVARSPNVMVRVYLPPWEQWERRAGTSFGFRAACTTHKMSKGRGFRSGGMKPETYWPGMFVQFNPGNSKTTPSAVWIVRAGPSGHDFQGPKISSPGWWTLGMSFTPDGQVHYYAHPGVEDLTSADHISTQNPYSYRAEALDAFFFNVVSGDNGNWSTPWIIDNAMLYLAR